MSERDPLAPTTATERTTVIVQRLVLGESLNIDDVMRLTGLKRAGAYALMGRVSRRVELRLVAGKWSLLKIHRV